MGCLGSALTPTLLLILFCMLWWLRTGVVQWSTCADDKVHLSIPNLLAEIVSNEAGRYVCSLVYLLA